MYPVFFHLGLHPGRSRDPCSSPATFLGPSHTQGAGSLQVLSARLSYGAVAGASPVAEAATSSAEVLDVGAGTVKRAQGKLELA